MVFLDLVDFCRPKSFVFIRINFPSKFTNSFQVLGCLSGFLGLLAGFWVWVLGGGGLGVFLEVFSWVGSSAAFLFLGVACGWVWGAKFCAGLVLGLQALWMECGTGSSVECWR